MSRNEGHTITEYAILLALLTLLGLGSLTMLGKSINNLLISASQPPGAGSLEHYMNTMFSPSANATVPGAPAALTPNTPQAAPLSTTNLLKEVSPVSVNVSSVDGSDRTSLGNFRLAQRIEALANLPENMNDRSYYSQLARLAYFMGANEGQIDGFDTYARSNYTKGDALNDLVNQSARFKDLLNNPPASLSQDQLAQLMPIVQRVDGIADKYLDELHPLLNSSNGKVAFDFKLDRNADNNTTQAPSITPNFQSGASLTNTTYDTLVSLDDLKAQVDVTLKTHPNQDNRVIETFSNARETDRQRDN